MVPFLLLCLLANEEEKAEREELIVKKLDEMKLDAEKREQNRIASEIDDYNKKIFREWETDNREIEFHNREIEAENRRRFLEWERERREVEEINERNFLEWERKCLEIKDKNSRSLSEREK